MHNQGRTVLRNNSKTLVLTLLIVSILMGCFILFLLAERAEEKTQGLADKKSAYDNGHRIAQGYSASEIDALVKAARETYNKTQSHQARLESRVEGKYTIFTNEYSEVEKVNFILSDGKYLASYYYRNGELYFAFIRNEGRENRFYVENGLLYRWIDEGGVIHDCELGNEQCRQWADILFDEAEEIELKI